jgi:hypothetical protein
MTGAFCLPVGASKLAMVVNENAGILNERDALKFLASIRASTGCSYKDRGE